jgi:hypothetical protein
MMVLANLLAPTQGIVMTAFVPMGKSNGTAQLAPVFQPLAPMTAYVATVQKIGIIIRVLVLKPTPCTDDGVCSNGTENWDNNTVLVRKQTYQPLAPMTAYAAMA